MSDEGERTFPLCVEEIELENIRIKIRYFPLIHKQVSYPRLREFILVGSSGLRIIKKGG